MKITVSCLDNINTLINVIKRTLDAIQDFMLPERCPGCSIVIKNYQGVCSNCWLQLKFITAPHCACCGVPFDYDIGSSMHCQQCLSQPRAADSYRSVFVCTGIIKNLLLKYKHGDGTYMAPLFARWLSQKIEYLGVDKQCVFTPVPLNWRRLFYRQYNQAGLIAQKTAKLTGHTVCVDLLKRYRHTPSQGFLSKQERLKNVASAIAVNSKRGELLRHKTVVLFDDVMASGATVDACTHALRQAGAAHVHVLTLARTV